VVDPRAFRWNDAGWKGLPLREYVLYELHVGTFTPEGTLDAAAQKLPRLRALGVTAIELMPMAAFPGERNWGYDGVGLYAPADVYGGPEALRRFVDACHQHGLAAVLDVVYNHLGPEGNYLSEFGPYFTARHQTPWGDAVNYDGPGREGVRRHFVHNARYWLEEFHFDALRLDAVHGIFDHSEPHVLAELAGAVEAHAAARGVPAFVIAESDLNDVKVIGPRSQGGHGAHAQWNDDFNHALHAVLTGARQGYFADFGRLADLGKALTEGFVYDGRHSAHRGRVHGTSSADRSGEQLVVFAQNHDQVANGWGGDRLSALVDREAQKLSLALLACAPYLPLLFMGQEWGETAPFHYFTSFGDPELARAVREGRAREFLAFSWSQKITDPEAEATFRASTLDWGRAATPPHTQLWDCTAALLALRRAQPALSNCRKDLTRVALDEAQRWLRLSRGAPGGPEVTCLFNVRGARAAVPVEAHTGPARLALSTAAPRFGGAAGLAPAPAALVGRGDAELAPHSAAIYVLEDT
jgi:maltooligosyltrehalose trehalohydrolase